MDTVASASGLSAAPPGSFGAEEMVAWVGRHVAALKMLRGMALQAIAAVMAQIEASGAGAGPLLSRLARLNRAAQLCVVLGMRVADEVRRWRSGIARGRAEVPPAPARVARERDRAGAAAARKLAALHAGLRTPGFGDGVARKSNAEIYRTICRLLGVTPDPTLFGAVGSVARAVAAAPVACARRWARVMARNRAREMVGARFGPPPAPERARDWAIRVGWWDDPPDPP
jgi:hypothetical protein